MPEQESPTPDPQAAPNASPNQPPSKFRLRRLKIDPSAHAAKLTAVLAVLAAVASGQYALQVSHTTLAQAEATDQWGYYQAKSIKKNVALSEARAIRAIALVNAPAETDAASKLQEAANRAEAEAARYGNELDGIKLEAEELEKKKRTFQRKGDFFNLAFVALQAGVILATVADNGKRKSFLFISIFAGLAGAGLALAAFLVGW